MAETKWRCQSYIHLQQQVLNQPNRKSTIFCMDDARRHASVDKREGVRRYHTFVNRLFQTSKKKEDL